MLNILNALQTGGVISYYYIVVVWDLQYTYIFATSFRFIHVTFDSSDLSLCTSHCLSLIKVLTKVLYVSYMSKRKS
jgi:hypothetical protein